MTDGGRSNGWGRAFGRWRWFAVVLALFVSVPARAGQGEAVRRFALRLKMIGYRPAEIQDILSGRATLAQITRKIRLRAMGYTNIETRAVKDEVPARSAVSVPVDKASALFRRASPYLGVIRQAARKHGVPPLLVLSVIGAESGFDPRAISPKGAKGLMQLMPATARALGVSDPFDPRENIFAGTRYLAHCLRTFIRRALALAAYNAGPTLVSERMRVPADPEILAYIDRVATYERRFRRMHVVVAP
jgi:soluble lytic murein transglycosylase-like protein